MVLLKGNVTLAQNLATRTPLKTQHSELECLSSTTSSYQGIKHSRVYSLKDTPI